MLSFRQLKCVSSILSGFSICSLHTEHTYTDCSELPSDGATSKTLSPSTLQQSSHLPPLLAFNSFSMLILFFLYCFLNSITSSGIVESFFVLSNAFCASSSL